ISGPNGSRLSNEERLLVPGAHSVSRNFFGARRDRGRDSSWVQPRIVLLLRHGGPHSGLHLVRHVERSLPLPNRAARCCSPGVFRLGGFFVLVHPANGHGEPRLSRRHDTDPRTAGRDLDSGPAVSFFLYLAGSSRATLPFSPADKFEVRHT